MLLHFTFIVTFITDLYIYVQILRFNAILTTSCTFIPELTVQNHFVTQTLSSMLHEFSIHPCSLASQKPQQLFIKRKL